jgi:hypothetical protein
MVPAAIILLLALVLNVSDTGAVFNNSKGGDPVSHCLMLGTEALVAAVGIAAI